MLSIEVNVDGGLRKLRTAAASAEDLEKPLAIFGGYLRNRALERFHAQSFPALAESTIKARARAGLASLESKLHTDLRKAQHRQESQRAPRGMLERLLGSSAMSTLVSQESRGVRNRRAVLAEFERLHVKRVSGARRESGFERQMGAQPATFKQQVSLAQRAGRAMARAIGQPVLGQLPRTLSVLADGDTMRMVEATHVEFTNVHNEGGTAGHGATEPERKTVVLESSDLDVLVEILEHHCLEPLIEE